MENVNKKGDYFYVLQKLFFKAPRGGKLLVKSISYTIILFSILTISSILSSTVNAAKKKTTSTKRAATTSKTSSKKRAAVSSARKATSTSTQRLATRTSNRNSAKVVETTTTTNNNNDKNCPVCPDCDTSSLKTEISSLNNENANLRGEIEKQKELYSTLNSENENIKKELKEMQEATKEPILSEAEEKARLEKLRIEKVPGTTDDYKCIKGWTNNWDEKLVNINKEIADSKVMDKYGVIKDEAERVKWGKYKKGCPISSKIEINENKYNYNTYLYLYKFNKENKQYEYMNEFIKPQLKPIAIVNLYMDSFPNIMERPWEKITPKLIFSYFFDKSHEGYMNLKSPKNVDIKKDIFGEHERPYYIGVIFKKDTQVKNILFHDIINEKYTILTFPVNYTDITFYDNFDYYDPVINPAIYPFWDYEP